MTATSRAILRPCVRDILPGGGHSLTRAAKASSSMVVISVDNIAKCNGFPQLCCRTRKMIQSVSGKVVWLAGQKLPESAAELN
jgi:hypothetical protein